MTNVMYHYVRPNIQKYPHFNNLDIDLFRKQLDYFQSNYKILSKEEYIYAIQNKKNNHGLVLTFDDGFKDHYEYVFPELSKRGLWGIFYISTNVYSSKKLLGVHRIHYLKGKYGSKIILEKAKDFLEEYMLDHEKIKEFDKEIYTFTEYEEYEKELRRLFNYYIKYNYRDEILDKLMVELFDENTLFDQVYMNKSEIKSLSHEGNIIGSHTKSHRVLSRLSYEEQYKEINDSFDFLSKIVDIPYKSFCYPYGYKSSYNDVTIKILNELKIDEAATFDNKIQDDNINKYELSRIDCNKFMEI